MRQTGSWVLAVSLGLFGAAAAGWAHSEHEGHDEAADSASAAPAVPAEESLTGEVVDVFCYLSHGEEGLGTSHAGCAKKCIKGGLPVAIKVGDQLYLASMADHNPANERLADLAGKQVTVRGKVMERDGQHLIAISQIE
ncbi:MAG: hypothetical protein HYT90_03635 [Candidatus Omnitrophica bacterium]|nr:hypothetical protein [Candidatus Omnitrophota bacterium]